MGDKTVHVGNMEANVNEGTLYLLFSQFGTISNVRLAGDPAKNTRFAFVEFTEPLMAQSACLLDGLQLGTRNLRVAMAKASTHGAPQQFRASAANPYGAVAAAAFGSPAASGRGNRALSLEDQERMTRTVHIRGVDRVVNELQLVTFFSAIGTATGVRIAGQSNPRNAWIEFASQQSALAALSLDGQQLAGQILRISPSKTAIQSNALTTLLPHQTFNQLSSVFSALPAAAAAAALVPAATLYPPAAAAATVLPPPPPAPKAVQQDRFVASVTGFDEKVSEDELLEFFSRHCGHVRRIYFTIAEAADGSVAPAGSGDGAEEDKKIDARVAMVEFETVGGLISALSLSSGTDFKNTKLLIEKVDNPPPLPPPPPAPPSAPPAPTHPSSSHSPSRPTSAPSAPAVGSPGAAGEEGGSSKPEHAEEDKPVFETDKTSANVSEPNEGPAEPEEGKGSGTSGSDEQVDVPDEPEREALDSVPKGHQSEAEDHGAHGGAHDVEDDDSKGEGLRKRAHDEDIDSNKKARVE